MDVLQLLLPDKGPDTMVLMWFGCSGHCGHADATCTGLFTVDIMGFSVFGFKAKSPSNQTTL